ncbi:MAG: FAD-dependent oxidoreductase [Deltaproteobacteria bacterium]|nr:FAD-dependent oxidoreductase [Deltaproteobacteria bacterium]
MSLGERSFFVPFSTLANLFKKPETIAYPKEDLDVHGVKGPSLKYRGMHANDHDVCIGCGNCSTVCPTAAINMISTGVNDAELTGANAQRPTVDYGRCCFCAFCVDACPSGSLTMTREYIFTRASEKESPLEELIWKCDEFTLEPGSRWSENPGWQCHGEETWLDLERSHMEHMTPEKRVGSFIEFVLGFTKEEALREAARCIECGICTKTCPANMGIPEYIRGIYDNDLEESVRVMYETNPLPGICGRICTHKCESVCAISHKGEPVAIRWLKRYAIDALGPDKVAEIASSAKEMFSPSGKKVAIIGAGPAGLSAAYYLSTMGHGVTVFERMPKAGGTMRYGIPAYRLPDESIDNDVRAMAEMGVDFRMKTRVGTDVSFESLRKDYDAVLVAVGFPMGRSTRIENHDHPDTGLAILLLNQIRLGEEIPVHENIVIIGGGNVAMDIARSMARLQKVKYGKVSIILTCLEGEGEMPADNEEIEESIEEGIIINPGWAPKAIELDDDGKIKGLKCARCLRVFDENRRFNPKIDEDDLTFYPGTQVVEAIGQASDYTFLSEDDLAAMGHERGRFKVSDGMDSGLKGVFIAGDIVHGPDVIHAVADGHKAARSIDTLFNQG